MFVITSPGASNPGMICEIRFNGGYVWRVNRHSVVSEEPQRTAMPVFAYKNVVGRMYMTGSTKAAAVTQKGVPVSQTWVAIMDRLNAIPPKVA